MCKAQNKKVELLNEGQNRTFTSSLDNAEKMKAHGLLPLLKIYAPRNILLVFSFIDLNQKLD